jgi:hypothetical protein
MLRFHIPLIKPDVQFSRIRLPDKESRFRPREEARALAQADKSQLLIEIAVGVACGTPTLELVLAAQPLAKPAGGVAIHAPVGFADWPQMEVVRPPHQLAVEPSGLFFWCEQLSLSARLFADLPAEPFQALTRRARAQIGPSRLGRPAAADRVAEKIEGFFRQVTQTSLRLVDRQLEPFHHGLLSRRRQISPLARRSRLEVAIPLSEKPVTVLFVSVRLWLVTIGWRQVANEAAEFFRVAKIRV